MSLLKVSVIVPNYNHAPYLRQRFDSIFNQTFQNFEVIILDDCSTDNSKEIIEEHRNHPQVSHIIYNKNNSGSPFKQWAKGFDLAQGEYIWIAESDDWAELTFLETLVSILDSNKQIALAFSSSNWVFPDHTIKVSLCSDNFEMDGIEFIKSKMICGNSIHNASAVVFRKENAKSISKKYTEFKGAGDFQFWVNLCETGRVFYAASCLNNFRKHHASTTQKCNSNGTVYKENYIIFTYMCDKGYISPFAKKNVISFHVVEIKRSSNQSFFEEYVNLWTKGEKNIFFYQSLCIFIGLCLRAFPSSLKERLEKKITWSYHYKNYRTVELVWNFLHLPNTNFREHFFAK